MHGFRNKSVRVASMSVACALVAGVVGCGSAAMEKSSTDESALAGSAFTPTLGPADVLSPDSIFYKDVTASPVATNSKALTDAIRFGTGKPMVDFSVKVMQVNAGTPKTSVQFKPDYTPDSDSTPVPVPTGGALEEEAGYTCTQGGDCHLIVVDDSTHKLFEMWSVQNAAGPYQAAQLSVWDLTKHYGDQGRGMGCTSADAAGLAIMPGLIGVRETKAGAIKHALRFILPNAKIRKGPSFVAPATHGTSATSSSGGPAFGMRLRLKPSFSEASVTSPGAKALVRALKTYGMILADGGNYALTGEDDKLEKAKDPTMTWDGLLAAGDVSGITPADFEVLDHGAIQTADNCTLAP